MIVPLGSLVRYTSVGEHYLAPTYGGAFDLGPFRAQTVYTVIGSRWVPSPRHRHPKGARVVLLCLVGSTTGWAYAHSMTVLV